MKYIFILALAVFATSCCGPKKTIENTDQKTENIAVAKETPKEIKTPPSPKKIVSQPAQDIKSDVKETIPPPPKPPKESLEYKNTMHKRWNVILQKHVSKNGNVDYLGIKGETEFDVYIDYLSEKQPDGTWSKQQKLAYWINAYNALTVDLILQNYPLKSIKDIKDPWEQRLWKFGNKWINLNYIEHQILRKMNEPRIHFAIVCASVSCPKLQNEAFIASKLEQQLTNSTKEFLSDSSKNELSQNSIKLSKIFKWFKKDFEESGSLIDFLNTYSEIDIAQSARKSYKDYIWDLNN